MKRGKWAGILLLCAAAAMICVSSREAVGAAGRETPKGVRLVRFDLHKSFNREVGLPAGIPGFFTYYYQGREYHYGFRFDRNGEGRESQTFGIAYVWAPYSIIHYDAAGGVIPRDVHDGRQAYNSTAYLGEVSLANTRGDGSELENASEGDRQTARYATDYTIYGNSLNLSEGRMPSAERDGYCFLGWYVWSEGGQVMAEETEKLAEGKEFQKLSGKLNMRFTEETKILENPDRPDCPAAEITVYAKWKEKEQASDE